MEEYRIADVTPQKEQDGVSKAGSETREVSSATSSFTNLDQVRRGACKNYLSAAIDKFYDYCDFYFSSPLDITEADRVDLLHQEFGLTGLSNHHGTCYLNAALQFTAEVVRVVEREGSPSEKQMLHQNLERLPHFSGFAGGASKTKNDQRNLYREVSCEVSKSLWFGEGGPSMNQLETGFKKVGNSLPYIKHLLTGIQAPQVRFQGRLQGKEGDYEVRALLDGSLDEFTQLQDPNSSTKLVGEVPVCFLRECTFKKGEAEPIGEVQIFHQDSNRNIAAITFAPKAVLIKTKMPNHAFCCIQKDGTWYEVNDGFIKKIPKEWEEDLFHFMTENGAMILYERQADSSLSDERNFNQKPSVTKEAAGEGR